MKICGLSFSLKSFVSFCESSISKQSTQFTRKELLGGMSSEAIQRLGGQTRLKSKRQFRSEKGAGGDSSSSSDQFPAEKRKGVVYEKSLLPKPSSTFPCDNRWSLAISLFNLLLLTRNTLTIQLSFVDRNSYCDPSSHTGLIYIVFNSDD